MIVKCPSCGAENTALEYGQQVVCSSCFHLFDAVQDEGAASADVILESGPPIAEEPAAQATPEAPADDPFAAFNEPAAPPAPEAPADDPFATFNEPAAPPAPEAPADDPFAAFNEPAAPPAPEAPADDPFAAFNEPAAPPVPDSSPFETSPGSGSTASSDDPFGTSAEPQPTPPKTEKPAADSSGAKPNLMSLFGRPQGSGSYRRNTRSTTHQTDNVFGPGSGAPRARRQNPVASRPRPSPNLRETAPRREAPRPQGEQERPQRNVEFVEPSPRPQETRDVTLDDPFGAPPSTSSQDTGPFGEAPASESASSGFDNPFADDNPFGDTSAPSEASASPGAADENPFNEEEWNPFGGDSGANESQGANPFGDTGGNPFDTDGGDAANAVADLLSADDGLTDASEEMVLDISGMGGGPPEPAAADTEGEEEYGALFELDLPESAPEAGQAPRKTQRRRRPGGKSSKRRSKRLQQKKKRERQMLVALVLIVGGASLALTDLGPFGINAILGEEEKIQARPKRIPKKKKAVAALDNIHADAAINHLNRIGNLKKAWNKNRRDKELIRKLGKALLSLEERYPAVYKNHAKLVGGVARKILTPKMIMSNIQLSVLDALTKGKLAEAETKLKARMDEPEYEDQVNDADQAYDLYLLARIARKSGKKERRGEALKTYRKALSIIPNHEASLFDSAMVALETGDYKNAQNFLKTVNANNNEHAGALYALSRLSMRQGKLVQAAKFLRQALTRANKVKDNNRQFQIYAALAELSGKKKEGNKREQWLKSAFTIREGDEGIARSYAAILAKNGQDQEAIEVLEKCKKAGCKSARFFEDFVKRLEKQGQKKAAVSELRAGLALHPADTGLLILRAKDEVSAKTLKRAMQTYRKVLEINPRHALAYEKLAELELADGKPREAAKTFETGVKAVADVDRLELMKKAARFHVRTGNTIAAKSYLERIVKLDTKASRFKLELAKTLADLGFLKDSLKLYEDLERRTDLIAPNSIEELQYGRALYKRGRYAAAAKKIDCGGQRLQDVGARRPEVEILCGAIATAQKAYEKSEKHLRTALKRKRSSEAFYYLARNYLAQNNLSKAVSNFTESVTLSPNDVDARLALARVLVKTGTTSARRKALEHLSYIIDAYESPTRPLGAAPKDPAVYLERGQLYLRRGKDQKALGDFASGLELAPGNSDLLVAKAIGLYNQRRVKDAFKIFSDVVKKDKTHPGAHYYMAKMLLAQNLNKKAASHFEKAIKFAIKRPFDEAYKAHRRLGYLYKEFKKPAVACKHFRAYLKNAPDTVGDRPEIVEEITRGCN